MFSSSEATMSGMAGDGRPARAVRKGGMAFKACVLTAAVALGALVPSLLPVDLSRQYRAETHLELPAAGKAQLTAFLAEAHRKLEEQAFLDQALHRIATALPAASGSQQQTALGFLSDLVTRRDVRPSAAERLERTRLAEQIVLAGGGDKDHRLAVTVRDPDLERAVVAANTIADLLASADNDQPLGETENVRAARQKLEKLQAELEAMTVPDRDVDALKAFETGQSDLAAERASLEASQAALDERTALLANLQPRAVIETAVPEALAGTGLEEARRRYQDAKLEVDQLSISLGPRHPRLIAAKATEDEARAAIATGLQRAAANLKQQQDGLKAQLQDLAKRQADLEAQPVSEAARKRLALENELDEARRVYLDALRLAEQAPRSTPSVIRLDRATAANAEASGLPAWLYALMGALAAACLAGAAMPGRVADEADDADGAPVADRPATPLPERLNEPRFAELRDSGDVSRPEAIRIATPSDLGIGDPSEALPPLEVFARSALLEARPHARSVDASERPNAASRPVSMTRHTLAARAANDAWRNYLDDEPADDDGLGDDALLAMLLANRTIRSEEQPLPVLLASILSRHDVAAGSGDRPESRVEHTAEDREMQELKRGIEALRRQVEEQLADREAYIQPRYASGR